MERNRKTFSIEMTKIIFKWRYYHHKIKVIEDGLQFKNLYEERNLNCIVIDAL